MPSKIEWTDETWNPIIGCSKVSPGCQNCHAERMAARQTHMRPAGAYSSVTKGKNWNGRTSLVISALDKPLHWRKPRKVFVCSMGDLFHESVPYEWIDRVFNTIAAATQHTFQILTKRPERMAEFFRVRSALSGGFEGALPNVWLGTSAENQETADERIPHLLKCPAAVRFVSCEPMLGPIDIEPFIPQYDFRQSHAYYRKVYGGDDSPILIKPGIDWVICGGESGPGARPMHPDWVRSLRDQCKDAGVPFMFKQWGEWLPQQSADDCMDYDKARWMTDDALWVTGGTRKIGGVHMCKVGKKAAGRKLDGVEHLAFPDVSPQANSTELPSTP